MGIDYRAVAGYGVEVKNNLTEKGTEIFENEYNGDDLEGFIEDELPEFDYDYIGCSYSGTNEPVLICSDPCNNGNMEKYTKFCNDLDKYKHLLIDVKPEWFCEVYVY